jgi:hypothetical protein
MDTTKLIRVDGKTYSVLKDLQVKTGVPMGKQVKFKVFGKPCKVKKLGEL